MPEYRFHAFPRLGRSLEAADTSVRRECGSRDLDRRGDEETKFDIKLVGVPIFTEGL